MDSINSNSTPAQLKKLLREDEVAAMLGISPRHVRVMRSQKLIPFMKLGRAIRMDPDAVADALKKLTIQARG